jgi:5-aminopentanamidase
VKIGHWQLECTPGDYEANIRKVVGGLESADEVGLEIVSFPESFITGYYGSEEGARAHSIAADGAEISAFLARVAHASTTFMVGFNEQRGDELYNTVIVVEAGEIIGTYSKAFPCFAYFTPGRDFPIFRKGDLVYGVVICADGGYIEPCRILALKGAQLIFAPHYNYLPPPALINHFQKVRSDHTARAVENGVWFLRGNNVCSGYDAGLDREGVGYGDSYLMDPQGEISVRSTRHTEMLLTAEVDVSLFANLHNRRSIASAKALSATVAEVTADL